MPNHENVVLVLGDTNVEMPPLSSCLNQVALMASDYDAPDLAADFVEAFPTTPQSPYPKQKNQRQKRKENRRKA